jgi:PKD repeat protein
MKTQFTVFFIFSSYILFSQNPIADFQVNIDFKCGYATTEFINNSVNADTFLWDVNGTGHYIETYEPRGSNIGIDKKWIVTLIAKKNGLSDTISKEVEIFNSKVQFDTILYGISAYAPLTVGFSNLSEIRESDTLTYQWDFGDGTQSTDDIPEHTYELPNTYYATLTGTNSEGCELSYSDYIIVKDTAQKGEFEFINSSCISESEASPCGYDKHYKLSNDSLIVYGFYSGNCGTHKTATVRYDGDTVKIKTWEVGPLTTCSCGYCFEIIIPNITQDSSIVTFNGAQISTELTNILEQNIENSLIKIFPNPVTDYLTINIDETDLLYFEFKIFDTGGRIIKTGNLNRESQIELKDIESGFYLLNVYDKSKNKELITRFIKE